MCVLMCGRRGGSTLNGKRGWYGFWGWWVVGLGGMDVEMRGGYYISIKLGVSVEVCMF